MPKAAVAVVMVAVVVGVAALYRQNRQLNGRLAAMQVRMNEMTQQRPSGNSGRREDPYIAGAVKNTILKHYAAIGAIYKQYLAGHPKKADGSIKMDWQIAPDGHVIEPGMIFSELDAHAPQEQAMLREMAGWRFPPPPAGMQRYVAHTFRFREHPMSEEEKTRARQSIVQSVPAPSGKNAQ